jgi:ribosome recycling factor
MGRLDPVSINTAEVKVGSENFPVNALAQVSAKSANSCVVSPFDSSQLDIIEKSLRIWNDSLDIKKQDNTLILTQAAQGKDAKAKLIARVKKIGSDRRE